MLHMDVYDLQRFLCKETPCVPCERLFVEGVQVNLLNRGGLVIVAFPNLEAYREDYLYSFPCPKYSQMSCLATTSAKPTVHSEMYTRYLRIRSKLIDVIDDLYGFTSINVVGDRFGGALAQMCALDLVYQYIFYTNIFLYQLSVYFFRQVEQEQVIFVISVERSSTPVYLH